MPTGPARPCVATSRLLRRVCCHRQSRSKAHAKGRAATGVLGRAGALVASGAWCSSESDCFTPSIKAGGTQFDTSLPHADCTQKRFSFNLSKSAMRWLICCCWWESSRRPSRFISDTSSKTLSIFRRTNSSNSYRSLFNASRRSKRSCSSSRRRSSISTLRFSSSLAISRFTASTSSETLRRKLWASLNSATPAPLPAGPAAAAMLAGGGWAAEAVRR
mmetsp:Transcript_29705/g.91433  ORF Transcript_29705/g.91433 Transcript_29705/m.91433 type:complete len:218 (+) Transcript_29705:56-709(+)